MFFTYLTVVVFEFPAWFSPSWAFPDPIGAAGAALALAAAEGTGADAAGAGAPNAKELLSEFPLEHAANEVAAATMRRISPAAPAARRRERAVLRELVRMPV